MGEPRFTLSLAQKYIILFSSKEALACLIALLVKPVDVTNWLVDMASDFLLKPHVLEMTVKATLISAVGSFALIRASKTR